MSIPHTHLPGLVTYADGLALQEKRVAEIRAGQNEEHLYLLEHEPVYTIGRTRDRSSLLNADALPHPLITISRGGQATYHGPGQLTGYPIINLDQRRRDLHIYIRALEQSIIDLCSDFGVTAGRREGMTGVWVEDRKLCSIGVGVRRWVALHGFALNVQQKSLPAFLCITPCGLDGVRMTCLEAEAGRELEMREVTSAYLAPFGRAIDSLTEA